MKERENQGRLESYLERAMAIKAALTLFEWDNETLAPQKAGAYTARIQGALSAAYQELMTDSELVDLLTGESGAFGGRISDCSGSLGGEERVVLYTAKGIQSLSGIGV